MADKTMGQMVGEKLDLVAEKASDTLEQARRRVDEQMLVTRNTMHDARETMQRAVTNFGKMLDEMQEAWNPTIAVWPDAPGYWWMGVRSGAGGSETSEQVHAVLFDADEGFAILRCGFPARITKDMITQVFGDSSIIRFARSMEKSPLK